MLNSLSLLSRAFLRWLLNSPSGLFLFTVNHLDPIVISLDLCVTAKAKFIFSLSCDSVELFQFTVLDFISLQGVICLCATLSQLSGIWSI